MNEIVGLQETDAAELSHLEGGGIFTNALNKVTQWVGKGNDGSASGAAKSLGKAIVALPAVFYLGVYAAGEQLLGL